MDGGVGNKTPLTKGFDGIGYWSDLFEIKTL